MLKIARVNTHFAEVVCHSSKLSPFSWADFKSIPFTVLWICESIPFTDFWICESGLLDFENRSLLNFENCSVTCFRRCKLPTVQYESSTPPIVGGMHASYNLIKGTKVHKPIWIKAPMVLSWVITAQIITAGAIKQWLKDSAALKDAIAIVWSWAFL